MQNSPILITTDKEVCPHYDPDLALCLPVNMPPLTIMARGTLLGKVTNAANDVQTLTITATGGTYVLICQYGNLILSTASLAYNANAATIQAALRAIQFYGTDVAVTGTGPFTVTFANNLANLPIPVIVPVTTSLTGGSASVAHTTTGTTAGTWRPYASGNTDGSQVPSAILRYDVATDASGQITLGSTAAGGYWGETTGSAPAWFNGTFLTQHLVGLDTNAVSAWAGAKLISGTTTAGMIRLP